MKPIRILVLTLLAVVPFAGSNALTCDLHKKVKEGDITAVRNMLDAGCDVDARARWGETPLHEAAKYYRAEIAQILIDAGAKVDFQNRGYAPLHYVSYRSGVSISDRQRREDTVRVLLGANANVKLRTSSGLTPLHMAAGLNVSEETSELWHDAFGVVIRMLVDAGADVDAKDNYGKTPLHEVSDSNRPADAIRALVKAGADVNAKSNNGNTPLHTAVSISRHTASGVDASSNVDAVRALVKAGANVNAKNNSGSTPLHNATFVAGSMAFDEGGNVFPRSVDVIRALVDLGADVNAKSNDGRTPLHLAASWGHADAIRVLVKAGADINVKRNDGNTPLHIASMTENFPFPALVAFPPSLVELYVETIRVLLEFGADDQIKNNAKLKPKAVGTTKEIRKLLKTPGLYWPIKAYAMGNASSDLVETSARIGCADKKDCRVFLECTDKDGDEFKGSLDSASKEATAEDSIGRGATVSLSASEIKTITGATGDEALDCALRSQQRITAQVWSSTDSVNANTTAYRLSEDNEARIQFKVGESNTPFVNIRCLAAKGERCTKTKLVCTDDRGRDWPKIKAGTIDRLNVYTVSTVQGADHRINKNDKGWYSCDIESENPFMVYATHFSTKGDSRSLVSTTAVSME